MTYKPRMPHADEPFFLVLGRDEKAACIARLYGYLEMGQIDMAKRELDSAISVVNQNAPKPPHHPKVRSCFNTADQLDEYYRGQAMKQVIG